MIKGNCFYNDDNKDVMGYCKEAGVGVDMIFYCPMKYEHLCKDCEYYEEAYDEEEDEE